MKLNDIRNIIKEELSIIIESTLPERMVGYKVMRYEDGELISGANSRIRFEPKIGEYITMPEDGVFLSTKKHYVLDYYSGLAEQEALLTFEFSPDDIVFGNPMDREPELGVRKVKLIDIEVLE